MTVESIRSRLAAGEGATTEFVTDTGAPSEVGRTVCAFLNGEGGQIYCGVGDDGVVKGLKGDAAALAQELELDLKSQISPSALFTAETTKVDDRSIVVVEVPQGLDRPYVFDGAVYLRAGAVTTPADAQTLRAMVRSQAEAPVRWERRISPMAEEDLDHDEVRSTVRKVEKGGRFVLSDRDDDLAVLSDFSMATNGAFTNAGDVLFSRRPSQRYPQCRVQFAHFASEKTDNSYRDNRAFEGPLVRVYGELISAIRSAIPIQSVFLPGESRRVDAPAYDIQAIEEGVVNAFVHRDYSAYSGGLRVLMFDNRIEIWNSGRLPEGLSPTALRREHPSILINPDIANVFNALDLMERIGRGTEKVVEASKSLGARPPLWRDEPSGVTLTIFASALTASGETITLNERQNRLLLDLQPGDWITPKAYQARYASEVSPRQARRDLEELEALKWLAREGATRSTKYRLP